MNSTPVSPSEPLPEDGLDHIFSETIYLNAKNENCGTIEAQPDDTAHCDRTADEVRQLNEGLSVAQTAVVLGLTERLVLKLIRKREICAQRNKETRSWTIDPECLHTWLQQFGIKPRLKDVDDVEPIGTAAPAGNTGDKKSARANTDYDLWSKLENAESLLRAASYRVGYLEAQLDNQERELASLPDLQAAAAKAQSEAQKAQAAEATVKQLQLEVATLEQQLVDLRRPWWQRLKALISPR